MHIYLVVDSLKQPHSFLQVFDQAYNMTFEIEAMQHFEGVASKENSGLEARTCNLSSKYMSPLHIQREMEPYLLYANPSKVRKALIEKYIYGAPVRGIWDETLVPAFYDVV